MSQQAIRQQARRTAREMAAKRRQQRLQRERRVMELAERVMVAIGERDVAVAEAEKHAGQALRQLTETEGLSLTEAVSWCGEALTVREARRIRTVGEGDVSLGNSAHPNAPASSDASTPGAGLVSEGGGR